MKDEQLEILEFFRGRPPFDSLDETWLHKLATSVDVRYCRADTQISEFGDEAQWWYIVRSGAVEVYRRNGTLYNRLTEGGYFGEFGLLRNKRVRFPARAIEDTLLYMVPEPVFSEVFDNDETFADAVEIEDRTRLRHVVSRKEDANQLMSATVDTLVGREAVLLDVSATVREAAQRMTEEGVSSVLVMDEEAAPGDLALVAGIVTDRDLRTRLVAPGLSYDTPVTEIMSGDLVTVDHNQLVFEAMMLMLRHNVHHLPVMRHRRPLGVIALSDIIHYESRNSLFVVGSIFRQTDVDGLVGLLPDVHACFTRMVSEDANSRMIGSAMAAIGRSFRTKPR